MELTNEFTVSVPVDQAWPVLTDVERIAPCMPGAQLQEVEGDQYRGVVKVKVGPITAQYKGAATFLEKDDASHTAVLRAEGRDVRGQGNASARITATLTPDGDGTKVKVDTDLTVTGKVAQFGRGVMADVSAKLLNQFVQCLHDDVLSGLTTAAAPSGDGQGTPAPTAAGAPPPPPAPPAGGPAATSAGTTTATATAEHPQAQPAAGPRRIEPREVAPVDLLETAGMPVAKRVVPAVLALVVLLWLLRRLRR